RGGREAQGDHGHGESSGYPQGLAGEAIRLEGRIGAIIDVIDALGSERAYKKPWAEEDIHAYIRERRGRQFDPRLVDAALAMFDSFREIRRQLPDKPGTGH